MSDKVDVAALAKLARLEVSGEELAKLEKEIPDILHFVEQIQTAATQGPGVSKEGSGLHNVMRGDSDPIESGAFTEKLLSAAPARKGDRVAVKQVISRKRS